jgi:Leucine-rich repeat (LRR) protein
MTSDELLALESLLPECRISYVTAVCGVLTDNSAQSLDLTGADAVNLKELRVKLPLLPELTCVALAAYALSPEELDELSREFPKVRFDMAFTVAETVFTRSISELALTGAGFDLAELLRAAAYLPGLTQIDLTAQTFSSAQALEFADTFPDISIVWLCELCGRAFRTDAAEINLNEAEIADPAELAAALRFFPNLTNVFIDNTNLTDAQIGAIADEYPGVRFIWTIRFDIYSLRTDAVAFSTAVNQNVYLPRLTSEEVFALKYCTDLEALDLGHNWISDLSFLSSLKKLKILILADNRIEDISVLQGLPELAYLELFMNRIADVSPLSSAEGLLDLNLCFNRISDPSPLSGRQSLERIWISHNKITAQSRAELQAALPNCVIDFLTAESTGNGWRSHPRYFVMRDVFGLEYLS